MLIAVIRTPGAVISALMVIITLPGAVAGRLMTAAGFRLVSSAGTKTAISAAPDGSMTDMAVCMVAGQAVLPRGGQYVLLNDVLPSISTTFTLSLPAFTSAVTAASFELVRMGNLSSALGCVYSNLCR